MCSVTSANDSACGTWKSGIRCLRQASTRSAGRSPLRASQAPRPEAPALASALTKVSLSAGARRQISPVRTSSPPLR